MSAPAAPRPVIQDPGKIAGFDIGTLGLEARTDEALRSVRAHRIGDICRFLPDDRAFLSLPGMGMKDLSSLRTAVARGIFVFACEGDGDESRGLGWVREARANMLGFDVTSHGVADHGIHPSEPAPPPEAFGEPSVETSPGSVSASTIDPVEERPTAERLVRALAAGWTSTASRAVVEHLLTPGKSVDTFDGTTDSTLRAWKAATVALRAAHPILEAVAAGVAARCAWTPAYPSRFAADPWTEGLGPDATIAVASVMSGGDLHATRDETGRPILVPVPPVLWAGMRRVAWMARESAVLKGRTEDAAREAAWDAVSGCDLDVRRAVMASLPPSTVPAAG